MTFDTELPEIIEHFGGKGLNTGESFMPVVDLIGYLAGAFILLTASMKTKFYMRVCNMAGNACFVVFGFMAGVMPVLVLNTVAMGLHLYRITQELRAARDRQSNPEVA